MKIKQLLSATVLAVLITAVAVDTPLSASNSSGVSHSLFGDLLRKYVADGYVNYAGFQSEEDKLDQYLEQLQSVDPEALSRNEQFAFYANAYNAWTIKLILSK